MAATPANIRTCGWNHMTRPSTISSTPITSEPAPAVVDMRMVRSPRVTCA
jgi:hypothetical protein